jgi:hypothetical protein
MEENMQAKEPRCLGVLDLGIQNKALLLKNNHKFYNKLDIPWVQLIWNSYYSDGNIPGNQLMGSFWWKYHLKPVDLFKAMARCNVGDGKSVYLPLAIILPSAKITSSSVIFKMHQWNYQ